MNVAISTTLRTKDDVCFFGIPESKRAQKMNTPPKFLWNFTKLNR